MALSKSLATPYGINAGYWVITSLIFDVDNQLASVTLSGYVDAAARTARVAPLASRPYSSPIPGTFEDLTRAAIYNFVRTKVGDALNGATVVADA